MGQPHFGFCFFGISLISCVNRQIQKTACLGGCKTWLVVGCIGIHNNGRIDNVQIWNWLKWKTCSFTRIESLTSLIRFDSFTRVANFIRFTSFVRLTNFTSLTIFTSFSNTNSCYWDNPFRSTLISHILRLSCLLGFPPDSDSNIRQICISGERHEKIQLWCQILILATKRWSWYVLRRGKDAFCQQKKTIFCQLLLKQYLTCLTCQISLVGLLFLFAIVIELVILLSFVAKDKSEFK